PAYQLLTLHWEQKDAAALHTLGTTLIDTEILTEIKQLALTLAAVIQRQTDEVKRHLSTVLTSRVVLNSLADFLHAAMTRPRHQYPRLYLRTLDRLVQTAQAGPSYAKVWMEHRWKNTLSA